MRKFDVIMPLAEKDIASVWTRMVYFKKYLPMKKLVIIGNKKVIDIMKKKYPDKMIELIDEDTILKLTDVKDVMKRVSSNDEAAIKRSGWYLQQFLKMLYAEICEDEYYLAWDSDTLPLITVNMIKDDKPVFHMKDEYYVPYFETMNKLIGINKINKKSFIAEHMLFNCNIMKTLIREIESNMQLQGEKFYEKILYAIDKKELSQSGFSEFETYGTFCDLRYPNKYIKEDWYSLREGSKYFVDEQFGEREAKWVRKQYMAISFEKSMQLLPEHKLYKNRLVQLIPFEKVKVEYRRYLRNKIRRIVRNLFGQK